MERRVKELAQQFRDENGRFPNRKGERDKLRDKALGEQLDALRKARKSKEDLARGLAESQGYVPRAGREKDLYDLYRNKRQSELAVQKVQGNKESRGRDNQSVVRAVRRVIKLEQESGRKLSEKEMLDKIAEFAREEYGR